MRSWKSPYWYVLMFATLVVFGLNLYGTIHRQNGTSNDFVLYAKFIDPIKFNGTITTPHFIYPLLVAVASRIFSGLSYSVLGASIVSFFQLILAHVLWKFLKEGFSRRMSDIIVIVLCIAIMLLAPVNLLTLSRHNGYFGYIGITVYHNPPIALCRPFALLNFLFFVRTLSHGKPRNLDVLLSLVTLSLATLMKPNYALIMIPAACFLAVINALQSDFKKLRFILLGTVLPGVLILGGQYLFTYASPNAEMGRSHVILAPFLVFGDRSAMLFPKFVLSILFPLSVTILFWKDAVKDRYFIIGGLLFLAGALQAYLLAESGERMYFGNFLWSAQLGLFLWFIACLRFFIQVSAKESTRSLFSIRNVAVTSVFALHVLSGIIWFAHESLSPGAYW